MADIQALKEAFGSIPSVGAVVPAVKNDVAKGADKLEKGASGFVKDKFGTRNDFIEIPAGTKTMTGEDFATLFPSASTYSRNTAEGGTERFISAGGGYSTDMVSGNLSSGTKRSFDTLTPTQKAAFEIVLLSKKYASMYREGDTAENDAVADAYTTKMADYRTVCESDGIPWVEVMNYASWELQQQSYEWDKDTVTMFAAGSAENERVLSNRAHAMLAECGDDEWQDSKYPALGDMDYESTFDTEKRKDVGFLNNVQRWFKEKWDKVKSFFTAPWRAVKSAAKGVLVLNASDNLDAAISSSDRKAIDSAVERAQDVLGAVDPDGDRRYQETVAVLGTEDQNLPDDQVELAP